MSELSQTTGPRQVRSPARFQVGRGVLGGLAIGLSASAVFPVLLAAPELNHVIVSVLVIALTFGGAALLAHLVAHARGEAPESWRTIMIGLSLPFACMGGLFGVSMAEALWQSQPPVLLFRVAFVVVSAAVAFVCTLVASSLFELHEARRNAATVAGATAVTYLLLALAVDPIPGFHVGGGDRAMPKVAALCNLVAGFVGGAVSFWVLVRSCRSPGA